MCDLILVFSHFDSFEWHGNLKKNVLSIYVSGQIDQIFSNKESKVNGVF